MLVEESAAKLSRVDRRSLQVLDMEASERRQRFTVKSGVDASLDERRRIHNGLPDLLLSMAQEEIGDLPSYIKECSMVYVPQIGYMLSIKPWADDLKVRNIHIVLLHTYNVST